jgi:hypothetical protein
MDTEAAEAKLKDYLFQGVVKEIFLADEAKSIAVAIGNHAEQLNAHGFGDLFCSLQLAYSDRQTLCVAKMFDKIHRYPTRTIPAILDLIEDHASLWSLPQRHMLEGKLISAGHERQQIQAAANASLSKLLASELRRTMPKVERADRPGPLASLTKLREARDKVIAHNEAVDDGARRYATWGEVEELVAYAKNFVTLISFGFLNLHMGADSESYHLTYDARRSSMALLRLLQSANLVP